MLVSTVDITIADAFNVDWDFEIADEIGEQVVYQHITFPEDAESFDFSDNPDFFTIPNAIPVPPGEWWEADHWDEIVYGEPVEEEIFAPFDLDIGVDYAINFYDMQTMTEEEMLEADLIYDILWGDLADEFPDGFWGFPVYGEPVYDEDVSSSEPGDAIDINDLPWGNPNDWSEDGDYSPIMPLAVLPSLRVATGGITARSVTLTGTVTSSGSAPVQTREFWIRRDGQANHQVYAATSVTGTTFSRTITGLLPGTTYHVRAVGRHGGSSQSGLSDAVTFRTAFEAPSVPQNFRVNPGNSSATLTWAQPTSTGGALITHFQVSSNNGSTWVNASSLLSHTFSNLQPGSYTFRVRAVNSAGLLGTQAQAFTTITRVTLPTVSGFRVGDPGSTSVTLSGRVDNNGGAPITEHGFWIRPINSTQMQREERRGSATTFSWTIWGLQPNTEYIARAVAANGVAAGAGQSGEIRFTTAAAAASAPTPFTVVTNNSTGNATLNWAAPSNMGGGSVIRYEVTVNNGTPIWLESTARSHTVFNLPTGTHTFRIRAVTLANGSVILGSQSQATATITRVSLPTVQSNGVVGTPDVTEVTLSGTIQNDGGANITHRGFFIRRADGIGGESEVPADTLIGNMLFHATIRGLAPDTDYVARAIARNGSSTSAGQGGVIAFRTAAAPTLHLPVTRREITAALHDITVDVRSNITWEVSVAPEAQSWLRVARRTQSNLPGNGDFTLRVDPNMGTTQRTGRVTVAGGNLTATFDVVQRPGVVVTLNANGGNVNVNTVLIPDDPVSRWLPTPTRAGHDFGGWFTAQTLGIQVTSIEQLRHGDTIFARWYTYITLNPNGGSIDDNANPTVIRRLAGTHIGLLPIPTPPPRSGYEFEGWFADGGTEPIGRFDHVMNHNETLTARWRHVDWIWHAIPDLNNQGNPHQDWVGFWPETIRVYSRTVGESAANFPFVESVRDSINAWFTALDVPIVSITSESNAQIRAFGGTREAIRIATNATNANLDAAGWAEPMPRVPVGTVTVDGVTRNVYQFSGYTRIFTLECRVFELAEEFNDDVARLTLLITMHELGHVLGFWGHSPAASLQDVMHANAWHGPVLQPREIQHLRQIYDRFRR